MSQVTTTKNIYLFESHATEGASLTTRRAAAEFIDWTPEGPISVHSRYDTNKSPAFITYNGVSVIDHVLKYMGPITVPLTIEILPLNGLPRKGNPYRHHGIHTLLNSLTSFLENSDCPYVVIIGLDSATYGNDRRIHSVYEVGEIDNPVDPRHPIVKFTRLEPVKNID